MNFNRHLMSLAASATGTIAQLPRAELSGVVKGVG